MKNLAILAILACFTTISNAQFLHVTTTDSLITTIDKQEGVHLNIPMLGNIAVKKMPYAFRKATMPFQIKESELDLAKRQSVDSITVPAAYSVRPQEDTLTSNYQEKRL